jgi:antitoxin component of RelBE/YafQ-DinJ toxin-antitoxin module
MARDVRVSFKLSEEKKAELEQFAKEYGVTMSALCALIVGQWLYQQNKVIAPIAQGMSDFLKEQLSQMDPADMAQLVAQAKE